LQPASNSTYIVEKAEGQRHLRVHSSAAVSKLSIIETSAHWLCRRHAWAGIEGLLVDA